MKIQKREKNVLLTNELGEYHFSHEEFNSLGEQAAISKATEEIKKKATLDRYQDKTITFQQAEELGFCSEGIRDFCEQLDLDLDATHVLSEVLDKLTVDAFLEYPEECRKLFGKDDIMSKFGGVKKFLSENRTRKALSFVLENKFIGDKQLHILACDFAENVLHYFEQKYPDDNRPRRAIEVKRLWIGEEYAS